MSTLTHPSPIALRTLAALAGLAAGSGALAQTATFNNPLGGSWMDSGNWNTGFVPSGPSMDAVLPATTDGVFLGFTTSIKKVSVATGARFAIEQTADLSIEDGGLGAARIDNNGTIEVAFGGSIYGSVLRFPSFGRIAGTGTIRLLQGSLVQFPAVGSGAIVVHDVGHTIAGVGNIEGQFENRGTIRADDIGTFTFVGNMTNKGTLEAVPGGTMVLDQCAIVSNTSGLITSSGIVGSEGLMYIGSASGTPTYLTHQEISSIAPGRTTLMNECQLGSCTITGLVHVEQGATVICTTELTNQGLLSMNTIGGAYPSLLNVGSHTLTGFGEVLMNSGSEVRFDSGTLDTQQVVGGLGLVSGPFTNMGLVDAYLTDATLLVTSPTITNHGALRASGGGLLTFLDTQITQNAPGSPGRIAAEGGHVQFIGTNPAVLGGEIMATPGSRVEFQAEALTLGDGVRLSGACDLIGGYTIVGKGLITIDAPMTLNAAQTAYAATIVSHPQVPTVLGGTADLILAGLSELASDPSGTIITQLAGRRIVGGGTISASFVNHGTVLTQAGQTLQLTGGYQINTHAITAEEGGTIHIFKSLVQSSSGTILAAGDIYLWGSAQTPTDIGGGTLASTGNGRFIPMDSVSLSSLHSTATISVGNGSNLTLAGGTELDGLVDLNAEGSVFGGSLTLDSNLNLQPGSAGTIRMGPFTQVNTSGAFVDMAAMTLSGRGTVNGSYHGRGTLVVGDFGVDRLGDTRITGEYRPEGSHTLKVEIADDLETPPVNDQLLVDGDVICAGLLVVETIPGFASPAGVEFPIITGATVTGTFSQLILPSMPGGLAMEVRYDADRVVLVVVEAMGCPADFDGDTTVDFFDYDAFVACFEGQSCPPGKTADFDGDGSADFFDYDAFVVAFETPC
ncbi:MAG: hypothetical protein AABZ53_02950 [Planctomycetota bacterium]